MNGPPQEGPLAADSSRWKLSKPLAKAIGLLEEAAAEQDPDAIYLLAEINFHGNYSHPRDFKRAFTLYDSLASLTGNSTAQHMLGFLYSTGIGDAVERDQAKALLYHTFAARAGNTRAEMTVAFRHHSGIGTPRNCHEAVVYYKRAADKAIAYARSGPPGGLPLRRESYHIADDDGGVYGEGASYSSSGHNAHKGGPGSDQNSPVDDVMEYLDLLSRKGDLKATFGLGKVNYDGTRTVKRNFKVARKYFMQVARQYWAKDDRVISDDKMAVGKMAAKAAAYLGRLYLRGEGVPQNFDKALRWFKLGVSNGEPYCQYEMGLMYLQGLGVKKDAMMAANYFKESAQQDWPASQVNLGKLFLDQGDLKTATTYFELALRHGHVEAFYHLAEINHFGVGRERSCDLASSYYKIVAEKAEALHSSFDEANQAYEEGDLSGALVKYMMAAEQGYEQAQANVAYLLDEHKSILSLDRLLPWKKPATSLLRNAALALVYYTRSAKQFNIDSTVKMGDCYLHGYGITGDVDKAAQCYQSAAEMHQSAQALWNLGWMHENGMGVEQDFHLAHRLYLEAADANSESYLPVKLSILKLRVRSWWNQLTDGKVNPIQPEPGMCPDPFQKALG
jgi:SEL1 protein